MTMSRHEKAIRDQLANLECVIEETMTEIKSLERTLEIYLTQRRLLQRLLKADAPDGASAE